MDTLKNRRFWISIILLGLFITPFCLNQLWYVGGPEWFYWTSSYLCYFQLWIVGLLFVLVPRGFRNWLNQNTVSSSRRKAGNRWSGGLHLAYILMGLIFFVIGSFSLYAITNRFIIECLPLSRCFGG